MGPVQTARDYERHFLTVTSQERGQETQDHVEQVRDRVYEQRHYKEQASCFFPSPKEVSCDLKTERHHVES